MFINLTSYVDINNLWKFIKLGKPQFAVGLFFYYSISILLVVLFHAEFVLSKFILGYAIIFFSTWAVHYHNDYFDFRADHFVTPTPISGGSSVLIEHVEWKNYSRNMAIFLISLTVALSIIFTIIFSYSMTFIIFVIIANLLAWFYAASPLRLSYSGLGEFGNNAIGILFPGLGFAMVGPNDKTLATKYCIYNLMGILCSLIMINIYFIYLILI